MDVCSTEVREFRMEVPVTVHASVPRCCLLLLSFRQCSRNAEDGEEM